MTSDPALEVVSVSKSYGRLPVLRDVSFSLPIGSCVGLIGPNGSGKTTLTEVISRFQDPDHGDVLFMGKRITDLSASAVARLGMRRVFQSSRYSMHLTARENLELGVPIPSWRTLLARRVSVPAALAKLFSDLGVPPNDHVRMSSLTLFQRRCIELIRAMLGDPKLVLLDEPTAGFTQSERRRFCALLAAWRTPSVAVLMIEHDFATIRSVCGRALVMNSGRIVADDSPDLLAASQLVRRIYLGSHAA